MFGKKNKILLIDMEKEFTYILKRCLKTTGKYRVIFAKGSNMGQWFASCPWHRPDLIIMDTLAPCSSTFETLKSLKQDRQTADIPVVILSAVDEEECKAKAQALKCDDYIVKPLEMKEFLSRMDAALCN